MWRAYLALNVFKLEGGYSESVLFAMEIETYIVER